MSDTTVNTNVAVEGGAPAEGGGDTGFDSMIAEMEQNGLLSDADKMTDEEIAAQSEEPKEIDPELEADVEEKIALKVNGKTIHKTMAEVKEMAQKYEATEMKLETAKREIEQARKAQLELQKKDTAITDFLKTLAAGDIMTIAEFVEDHLKAGPAFKKGVINFAVKQYEYEKMTPEQRKAYDNEKLVNRYKAAEEARMKAEKDSQFNAQVEKFSQQIATDLPKALTTVGLPNNDYIRGQVIQVWENAIANGKNPTAEAVANHVKKTLEEAGINLNTGAKKSAPPPQRPKASPETAKKFAANNQDKKSYIPYSEYRKQRGK